MATWGTFSLRVAAVPVVQAQTMGHLRPQLKMDTLTSVHIPWAKAQNQWDGEVLYTLVDLAKGRKGRKNCRQIIKLTSASLAAWCVLATQFWLVGCGGR